MAYGKDVTLETRKTLEIYFSNQKLHVDGYGELSQEKAVDSKRGGAACRQPRGVVKSLVQTEKRQSTPQDGIAVLHLTVGHGSEMGLSSTVDGCRLINSGLLHRAAEQDKRAERTLSKT